MRNDNTVEKVVIALFPENENASGKSRKSPRESEQTVVPLASKTLIEIRRIEQTLMHLVFFTPGASTDSGISGTRREFLARQCSSDLVKMALVALRNGDLESLECIWAARRAQVDAEALDQATVRKESRRLEALILQTVGRRDDVVLMEGEIENPFRPSAQIPNTGAIVDAMFGKMTIARLASVLLAVAAEGSTSDRPRLLAGALALHFRAMRVRSPAAATKMNRIFRRAFGVVEELEMRD